jgi:hypothetical protein
MRAQVFPEKITEVKQTLKLCLLLYQNFLKSSFDTEEKKRVFSEVFLLLKVLKSET